MSRLPRLPKVLADELFSALAAVKSIDQKMAMELLAKYRRNRLKTIGTWGINSIGTQVSGLEEIPREHFLSIERLDKAFQKLHHYRDGGAGEYAAEDVGKVINSYRAKLPRSNNNAEIWAWLQAKDYLGSASKKGLVAAAVEHFSVSESTVNRAIRAGNLARRGKSTVTSG